jgi:hypothetical protein
VVRRRSAGHYMRAGTVAILFGSWETQAQSDVEIAKL